MIDEQPKGDPPEVSRTLEDRFWEDGGSYRPTDHPVVEIFALYLTYFWDGWRQFGSRYTLDFTPLLIVALALRNDPRPGIRTWVWPLGVVLCCAINLWGIWYWQTFLN